MEEFVLHCLLISAAWSSMKSQAQQTFNFTMLYLPSWMRSKVTEYFLSFFVRSSGQNRAISSLADPTPLDVPPVDILTYAFEGNKNYDQEKVYMKPLLGFALR